MKPLYDREKFDGIYVDPVCVKKKDIYGIIVPLIPITTDYSDSAIVQLSAEFPFVNCPEITDSQGKVFLGELKKENRCVYKAKPDSTLIYSFVYKDVTYKWKYQLSEFSLYVPWSLIQ